VEESLHQPRIPRPSKIALLALLLPLTCASPSRAWGRLAHQMVNAAAIKTLPQPLRSYFKPHQFYLVEHASDPDLLADQNSAEHQHHFADIEAYDSFPFHAFRKQFVVERRSPTPIELREGDAPWQIERLTIQLSEDFRNRRWGAINHDAVFLAHYAADLTQPLHTVLNYNGQLSGQIGIHGRFETAVVAFYQNQWILRPQPASDISNLRARIFNELLTSYRARTAIFNADRRTRSQFQDNDPRFLPTFAEAIGPAAKARLEDAACFVGSLWYTAWVKAQKPILRDWKSD
jgi:hypothetical protein